MTGAKSGLPSLPVRMPESNRIDGIIQITTQRKSELMSHNKEKKDHGQYGNADKAERNHATSSDMADQGHGSLFQSVRSFLKQEEETYGHFQIPELPQKKAPASAIDTTPEPATALEPATTLEPDPEFLPEKSPAGGSMTADAIDERPVYHKGESGGPEAARTLDELFEICLNADVLRTDLADTRLVFGTGNPGADLMLIGEAPGLQEDKQGEPFVGRAGQLLNKILEAISFRREDVYIANILKHRPPNNRDPLPEERDRSLPYLYRQIELIKPKLILCLGRISAQTLLNTAEPMKNLRGRFHPFLDGIELMVTFHPAALLRNPAWKRDTWEDVQLLRKRYDELTDSIR